VNDKSEKSYYSGRGSFISGTNHGERNKQRTEMHLAIRRLTVRARAGGKWRSGAMRLAIRWWKRRNGVWKHRRWKIIYFYTPVQDPDDKALLELCTPPPIYKPDVWRTMNVVRRQI